MKRTFEEIDTDSLIEGRLAQNTKQCDSSNANIFNEFLTNKKLTINTKVDCYNALEKFFGCIKRANGIEYAAGSYSCMFYSIARYILATQKYDILKDAEASRIRLVIKSKLVELKRIGKGVTNHTPTITDDDMVKISQLVPDGPVRLQLKVWFILQFHLCRRGVENTHAMLINDVEFKFDGDCNKEFLQLRDSQTKNHSVSDGQRSCEARLYAESGELCPLAMIRYYISKLN